MGEYFETGAIFKCVYRIINFILTFDVDRQFDAENASLLDLFMTTYSIDTTHIVQL